MRSLTEGGTWQENSVGESKVKRGESEKSNFFGQFDRVKTSGQPSGEGR